MSKFELQRKSRFSNTVKGSYTDLVILKPGSPKKIYGSLSSELAAIEPPVWGGMVASFIRDKGFSVKMVDMETQSLDAKATAVEMLKYNPLLIDIVVMGPNPSASSTPLMPIVKEVLQALKEKSPDTRVILTGIHPSALPEKTLREEKTDFVAQGENFYTILHLLEALKEGKNLEEAKIPGLWFLQGEKLVSGGWGELIRNPEELPPVAWDLLDMDKYRAHNWHCFGFIPSMSGQGSRAKREVLINQRQPYAVIYTSLGCPNNCSYCNIRTYYDGKPGIRFRSPKSILEEIDLLVNKYKVKNIKFLDELFAVNENRVNQICDPLIKRGYDLNIWAYARIDTVNQAMLEKMKKAGIRWVCYGIEAGNKDVRKGVSKIGFDKDKIKEVLLMTKKAGVYTLGNFIFGLPDDNLETMQETFDLAKELKCEYANFYATMAYPGSRLYEEAIASGKELPKSWLGFAQLNADTLPLATKYISGRDVLKFRDKAFKEYHSDPQYLEMIEKMFGTEVVSHIKEMLKHEIIRNYA